ncbi:MAG: pectin acetylesterase-family hydrolase [Parvibaculum sp.]
MALAADEWETIAPGGETSCALGTPYSFHARRGDPEKLVVFFNGGGACWAGQTCDPSVEPTTYVPSADMTHNDPRTHKGIFDLAHPANPVGTWSMLFVSYCTGDVHLGEKDQTYTKPDGTEVTIRHRGHVNSHAALDWMRTAFQAPKTVLVAGSSAGAIAAPIYAGVISKIYPDARLHELSDGAGGYSSPKLPGILTQWGVTDILPDWAKPDDMPMTSWNAFTLRAAETFPAISFAQYDAAHDRVQAQFQAALEADANIDANLRVNRAVLAEKIEGFAGYTAGGAEHTILRAPYLYTYSVDGLSFVDWLTKLVKGETLPPVDCHEAEAGCARAPS